MATLDAAPAAVREATTRVEQILTREIATALDTSALTHNSRLDEATHKLTLAYAAYTLFYALLRTCGKPTSVHRVKAELSRVKHYMIKLKKVGDEMRARGDTSRHLPWTHSEPMLRVNAAAATRIVHSALAANVHSSADDTTPNEQRPAHRDRWESSRRSSSHRKDASSLKLQKRRSRQRDGQRLGKKARKTKLKGH